MEYDRNEEKFFVYADPCILKDRKALDEIDREFHLFVGLVLSSIIGRFKRDIRRV